MSSAWQYCVQKLDKRRKSYEKRSKPSKSNTNCLFFKQIQDRRFFVAVSDRLLGANEVKATAKTLSKWVWKKRHDLNVRPKVLKFTDETATERMQAGAAFTNQKRRDTSLEIVRTAYQELLPIYGSKLTPRIVSAHTGQNIKTARKYLTQVINSNE